MARQKYEQFRQKSVQLLGWKIVIIFAILKARVFISLLKCKDTFDMEYPQRCIYLKCEY